MAYDLWLWLQLRSHSGVWVAKLVLVEQSTQAVLAWGGDLALKHHVGTVTGSWGTMQLLDLLQKSHRKLGREWDNFSFADTVAAVGPDRLMLSVLTAAVALWLPGQLLLLPPPTCWSEAGTSKEQLQPRTGCRNGRAVRKQSTRSPGCGFVCWHGKDTSCK